MNEPAMTAFGDLVRRRWSCRRYRTEPVPRAHLERLLEAARLAPSACNRQPWRFAVATAPAARRALATRGLLPGLGMAGWVAEAPAIIALGVRRDWATHRLAAWLAGVDFPWLDAGIAGEHLVLQAAELGLGTCWIGWIRPRAVRRIAGWPLAVRPVALVTVGWPSEEPPADGPESRRRPLADLCRWLEGPEP
jgi:nitroreductase